MKRPQFTTEIRIFDMDGSITWIAAATVQEAVKCFAETLGYDWGDETSRKDFKSDFPGIFDEARELTPDQMDSLIFVKEWEGVFPADDDQTMSFRERLEELKMAGQEFPVFFATSEY